MKPFEFKLPELTDKYEHERATIKMQEAEQKTKNKTCGSVAVLPDSDERIKMGKGERDQ